MRARSATAAILGWLLASAAAAAQGVPEGTSLPSVLRLEDALALLRGRGLDLLIAEAAVSSAEGDARSAAAIANPQLSASYGRSRPFGSCADEAGNPVPCSLLPDPLIGVGLSDQAAIFDALTGKRRLRMSAAWAALEAAKASRDAAERTLATQVKQQFLQVLLGQEALRFAREVANASARTLELTRTRYEAGAVSEADVARVEVAKLEADQAADTADQALRGARAQLAFLLGVRGTAPAFEADGPELDHFSRPRALALATPEALLGRARERRPDLRSSRRQLERAEAGLALARRQRIPDVTLSLAYAQQGTTNRATTPPTFTAALSLPIPIFHQQQGEIERAEVDVSTQALQAAKLEAQAASDVATGFADYEASSRLVQRMEGGLLERARRARDLVQIQYQKGAASLLDYLDAQRTFIATSVEYRQDLAAYWTARSGAARWSWARTGRTGRFPSSTASCRANGSSRPAGSSWRDSCNPSSPGRAP